MDAAYTEDANHGFQIGSPGAYRLIKDTGRLRSANRSMRDKRVAAAAYASALTWAGDTNDLQGTTSLLVDDVFTSGTPLQHVALRSRTSRAADDRGLVLARVPWNG